FRKLTIEPGGIVPWHSHADRPAIIYVAEGEIIEHASTCAVPIVHKAGEIRPETYPIAHWWQNNGSRTVVLFVGDVLHDKSDKNMCRRHCRGPDTPPHRGVLPLRTDPA